MPFAAPPVGPLRFKPPQPVASWANDTIKKTTLPKGGCPQLEVFASGILGPLALSHNEDCLYLNIFVPPSVDLSDPASTAKVPVMFWIFGGGFFIGSGLEFGVYDGKKLAANNNVIVVSHNYRLAVGGFLAHPALMREDPDGSYGNVGMRDQVFALNWTNRNIGGFARQDFAEHFFRSSGAALHSYGPGAHSC